MNYNAINIIRNNIICFFFVKEIIKIINVKKNKLKIFIKKKYYYNNLCKNIEFINIETNFIN